MLRVQAGMHFRRFIKMLFWFLERDWLDEQYHQKLKQLVTTLTKTEIQNKFFCQ